LNDGSGKTNYPGTIDRGFTVYVVGAVSFVKAIKKFKTTVG
jgi:hypothetical protein